MGKGNGKGKDDSTVIGKALLISSGFGIFLCFVGIIVTFASVTYTPPTEAYIKCAKALQFSCDKTDCSTASGDTPAVTPGGGSGSGSGSGTGGGTTGTGTGSGTGSGSSTGGGTGTGGGGGGVPVPTILHESLHYKIVSNVKSCETYPDQTFRTMSTLIECQIASDEINSVLNSAAGYQPKVANIVDAEEYDTIYPSGCYQFGSYHKRTNGIWARFNTKQTPSSDGTCTASNPCICAFKDTPKRTVYPKIIFRSSDNYQLVTSRTPKSCTEFDLFPIMDPDTCIKALTDMKLEDTKPASFDIFTNEEGQSNGCYYNDQMKWLYIEKEKEDPSPKSGTDGACQLDYPCLCANTLAASNITTTINTDMEDRRLRSSSNNEKIEDTAVPTAPTAVKDVSLREWADRHLVSISAPTDGICGSSLDTKGCCTTVCGGSEYISFAACTSTSTETCDCTNAEKADQTYCSGSGTSSTSGGVITCTIVSDASPREGSNKDTPICNVCASSSPCTVSYTGDVGESCVCSDTSGNAIIVNDATCKTLWTMTYSSSMCCGYGPADALTAVEILPTIRMLCFAALISVIVGLLPIFLGGLGKMYRMETFSIVSGTVGLVFQWCCGFLLALIFILIPYLMGVVAYTACDTIKVASSSYMNNCANIPECSYAFDAQVNSICAIGGGLRAASGFTLFCVLLSVATSFLTCIGFCITKKDENGGYNNNNNNNPLAIAVLQAESAEYKPI